jgi:hypothetical protein
MDSIAPAYIGAETKMKAPAAAPREPQLGGSVGELQIGGGNVDARLDPKLVEV